MQDNNLVQQMFAQINNLIDYKLSQQTTVKSATVCNVNQDDTVDVIIPPNKTIYHNIQNQSIYRNLKIGDNVKVIVENGNLSSMWIIGGFSLNANKTSSIDNVNLSINEAYPVGSIYLSITDTNPSALFGGRWEQIKDRFLLGQGDIYHNGDIGGEAEHILTTDEMPKHQHKVNMYDAFEYHYINNDNNDESVRINGAIYNSISTEMAGNNEPHNNMPPYLVVYMWKRIG